MYIQCIYLVRFNYTLCICINVYIAYVVRVYLSINVSMCICMYLCECYFKALYIYNQRFIRNFILNYWGCHDNVFSYIYM